MSRVLREKSSTIHLKHSPLGTELEKSQEKSRGIKEISQNQKKGKFHHQKSKQKGYNQIKEEKNENYEDYDDSYEEYDEKPAKIDSKILKEAKLQRQEMERNAGYTGFDEDENEDNSEEGYDSNEEEETFVQFDGEYVTTENVDLSEAEEALVQRFLGANKKETRTLADIIMEKIREKEMEAEEALVGGGDGTSMKDSSSNQLPPKVIEVYTAVGKLLKHYKSGKLPKALKMLPHLKNWEDVMWLTRPDEWSPGATYACTRIFSSNLNAKMAQRFYNMILLEKCRDDIRSNQKLNYHLYMALKKALFKPAAFYKGIILPLAQSMSCTLREAVIFGSVLAKVSIQGNHSAATLLRLVEMPYSGCTSVFIKILLNKKYALPRRVIDALVDHFTSFETETRTLPVLWHQALLVFAQRYKLELDDDQKERMKQLMRTQQHHSITPEIRRELFAVRG